LAPDHATARNWYANYLAAQRRFDDAHREAQAAATLDPLNVTRRMGVGHMLLLARRYDEAVQAEMSALEIERQFWLAYWVLGMAYEQLGEPPRAINALRYAADFSGGNPWCGVCWVECLRSPGTPTKPAIF
jgi:tetratricopeptide (TPR) repeat protein